MNVYTVNGKQITGIRVSEDDDEIVLRVPGQVGVTKIAQEDVDEVVESKVSLMPAGLTTQLKNRGEFDDLMKYVLETRKP